MTFMKLENEGIGIRPFGPVLYCNRISDRMKDEINYHAEHSKIPHNHMLAGNIDKEVTYEMSPETRHELELMFFDYCNILASSDLMPTIPSTVNIRSIWINVQKKGEWNPAHIHAADFSCVAYTKIPKELKEEWKHPTQRGRHPTAGCVEFKYGEILPASKCNYGPIQPAENDIIFFPAWLHHHVYPFNSDVERISFSTNFDLPPDCKYQIS